MEMSTSSSPSAFEYLVRVQPHHTDYAGVVWHGTYIAWMEEARVEYLRSLHIDFAKWVDYGVDLPVVDLSLQYRQPLMLGMEASVKCWLLPQRGIRIIWQYDIQDNTTQDTCVSGQVTLAPVNRKHRRILRQLPEPVKSEMARLFEASG
jgi:acyl-CoA thioester hydrolase